MGSFLTCFVHGINFVLCLIDLFVGRNVFYLKHVFWFFGYAACYIIFSLVQYWAKIGRFNPCTVKNPMDGVVSSYPADECPVYAVIDWHKPTSTGLLACMVLFCF